MINQISWKNISSIRQEVSTWQQNPYKIHTPRHNPKAVLEINKNITTMAFLMAMPQK